MGFCADAASAGRLLITMRRFNPMTLILICVSSLVFLFFTTAFGLILSQNTLDLSNTDSIAFDAVSNQPQTTSTEPPLTMITIENGSYIQYRHFPAASDTAPLAIIVHGSGWHGGSYLTIGAALAEKVGFEVLVPDLRGHGPNPERRGDVDYIGQFEDDLAALINAHGGEARNVVMVGHSSGGGLTIRFAGGTHGSLLDRAVLIAPYLHHSAPTFRETAGGWAHPLVRRIIGLSMLNAVGITAFNDMTVIQFNYPETVLDSPQGHTATQAYTYRLNASFNPRENYLADISRLPEFLLIAGADDDAFFADQYETTMAAVSDMGTYEILPKTNHIGILNDKQALELIVAYAGRPFGVKNTTSQAP